jgi:cytochrome c556
MRIGLPIALIFAPLVALCVAPPDTRAHGEAKGIIKERMEIMSDVGREMKCIGRMTRGQRPLDRNKIAVAAGNIGNHGKRMAELFPKGSNNGVSRASTKIWEKWDLFLSNANQLVTAAGQLEYIATKGEEKAIKASYKALSKTCGGCHKLFRTKKKTQKEGI